MGVIAEFKQRRGELTGAASEVEDPSDAPRMVWSGDFAYGQVEERGCGRDDVPTPTSRVSTGLRREMNSIHQLPAGGASSFAKPAPNGAP